MARATPLIPERYVPLTYRRMQEGLSDALAEHIRKHGLTAGEISRRWPTCRKAHLDALERGEGETLGLKMLMALAEASGLKVETRFQ